MAAERKEFAKYKRALLKENGIDTLICARCGRFNKSIHLHHIEELVFGGENTAQNLIPLCVVCHHEWDSYDGLVSFEEFLKTPTTRQIALAYSSGQTLNQTTLKLCKIAALVNYSIEWDNPVIDGESEKLMYYDEMERQNKIFNKYDYCTDKLALSDSQET